MMANTIDANTDMIMRLIGEGYEITIRPGNNWAYEVSVSNDYHGQGDTIRAALEDAYMQVPEDDEVALRWRK